jgi:hypothetical protein
LIQNNPAVVARALTHPVSANFGKREIVYLCKIVHFVDPERYKRMVITAMAWATMIGKFW